MLLFSEINVHALKMHCHVLVVRLRSAATRTERWRVIRWSGCDLLLRSGHAGINRKAVAVRGLGRPTTQVTMENKLLNKEKETQRLRLSDRTVGLLMLQKRTRWSTAPRSQCRPSPSFQAAVPEGHLERPAVLQESAARFQQWRWLHCSEHRPEHCLVRDMAEECRYGSRPGR